MPGEIFRACHPFLNFLYDGNHILSPRKTALVYGSDTVCSSNNKYIRPVPD
jgi:hypothetical protein